VGFERRCVRRFQAHLRSIERAVDVAAVTRRLELSEDLLCDWFGQRQFLSHVERRDAGAIARAHERGRIRRLLERFGNHQRDRLAVVTDLAILQE
jgi:hypothetical protein